jgi:hypothetical protein
LKENERYEKRIAAYDRISADLATWTGELEEWVKNHIAPLVGRIAISSRWEISKDPWRAGRQQLLVPG